MPERILETKRAPNPLAIPDATEETGTSVASYQYRLADILCELTLFMQKVTIAADQLAAANAQQKADYNHYAYSDESALGKALKELREAKGDDISKKQAAYQTELNKVNAKNDELEQNVQTSRTEVTSCATSQSQIDQNNQGIMSQLQFAGQLIAKH